MGKHQVVTNAAVSSSLERTTHIHGSVSESPSALNGRFDDRPGAQSPLNHPGMVTTYGSLMVILRSARLLVVSAHQFLTRSPKDSKHRSA